MAESANVAKYTLGGSGDNRIADGYIRTVEKVWIDSYTIAFTNTNTTVDIAVIPQNKKITGIEVIVDTSVSQSNGTLSVGYSTDAAVASFLAPSTLSHALTRTVIGLPIPGVVYGYTSATLTNATTVAQAFAVLGGFQKVTAGTQTTISVKLNNWTMTTGTIKSIVRYT